MQPPRSRQKLDERESRLRRLLAMEIDRIVEDLELRYEMLVTVWTRHRDRGPLLDTLFSRWNTLTFPDLAEIDIDVVVLVDTFQRELDVLRNYVRFTEDMPTTLGDELEAATHRLRAIADLAIAALGGLPDRPMIEFDDPQPSLDALSLPVYVDPAPEAGDGTDDGGDPTGE